MEETMFVVHVSIPNTQGASISTSIVLAETKDIAVKKVIDIMSEAGIPCVDGCEAYPIKMKSGDVAILRMY